MAAVNAQSATPKSAAGRKSAPIVPEAVLEHLAKLARPAGISLLLLRPDGTVAWHDHGSGVLYERFLVPALTHTELLARQLHSVVGKMTAQSGLTVWDFVPGMILCAAPLVERRQINGVLVLAGKCEKFSLDEDVLRVCSQIGLDSIWLEQQAKHVTSHGPDRLSIGLSLFTA